MQEPAKSVPAGAAAGDPLLASHLRWLPDATDRVVTIRTPENIELSYHLAGAGTRGAAYLVDLFVQGAALFVPLELVAGMVAALSPLWGAAALGLATFALHHGYFVFFEWRWAGQSPGKRFLGVRVIKEGGYSLTFTDSLLRNLLRIVDFLPFANAVGLTSTLFTERAQRLGDLVAGTLVVRQEALPSPSDPLPLPAPDPALALVPASLAAVSSETRDLAVEFFRNVAGFSPRARAELAAGIAAVITNSTGLAPAQRQSAEGFLAEVIRALGETAPEQAPRPG